MMRSFVIRISMLRACVSKARVSRAFMMRVSMTRISMLRASMTGPGFALSCVITLIRRSIVRVPISLVGRGLMKGPRNIRWRDIAFIFIFLIMRM